MRFQFRSDVVDTLLKETLRILILIGTVGGPFSGTQCETKAMEMTQYTAAAATIDGAMAMAATDADAALANAKALQRTPAAPAAASATAAHLRGVASAKNYPTMATAATDAYAISSAASDTLLVSGWQSETGSYAFSAAAAATSAAVAATSTAGGYSAPMSSLPVLHRISKDTHNTYSLPTSENSNDSNEIDSMDYVMTKHIASHATLTHINKTTAEDLSSLSLLSANDDTTATSSSSASSSLLSSSSPSASASAPSFASASALALASGAAAAPAAPASAHKLSDSPSRRAPSDRASSGSGNHTVTFQHIGSQRIALKSTANTKTTTAALSPTAAAAATAGGSTKHTNTRPSANKVESKYVLPKPQKTDAPMLNYIFDTFSSANKHHHHDQRYGPHFEDVQRLGQPTNMTVQAGSSIHLNCRISLLQDKTVSWVRRNAQGENALDLLTVGLHTYTGDKRYKMEFQYPNNWRLKISNVKKDDEAMYECQISTHPPRVIQINLLVNAPKVMVVDEFGDPLQEKYYEIDSTLQLSCVVRNVAMATSVVYWKHGEDVLNYDVTRGGISVKTELMDDGANSTLSIAKINKSDSGNYTCSISDFQNFSIVVHILNGESFAELHHGGAAPAVPAAFHHTLAINFILLSVLLLCLPPNNHNIHR